MAIFHPAMRFTFPKLLIAGFCLSSWSSAAVVLTIDISNPNAVVVTAVANNSQSAGELEVDFNGGVSLRNFFTATVDLTEGVAVTGNWTGRGTIRSYNELVSFAYGSADVVPGVDLSIYYNVTDAIERQKFVTTAPPFTGTSTFSLAGIANLPALGSTGDIHIGYNGSNNVLGQYLVIPEPATLGLLAFSGLLLGRRRR